jgi:predicted MarR family transcription regulator
MKWEEVRKLYPDQYVKLNILEFYLEDNKKIVTDVALINVIEDSKLATKELLKSKGNTVVYHTGSEKIVIEVRTPTGLRGMRL